MEEKDLKKLKRPELLEIMLAQSREIDALREELQKERQKNQEKELLVKEAGSIAEASLKLSGIFEDAQKAADTYIRILKEKAEDGKL